MLMGGALAAGDHLGAFLDGIGDVRLDLLDRLHVDHRTRFEPVGDFTTSPRPRLVAVRIRTYLSSTLTDEENFLKIGS
jgi:hypothetical protein